MGKTNWTPADRTGEVVFSRTGPVLGPFVVVVAPGSVDYENLTYKNVKHSIVWLDDGSEDVTWETFDKRSGKTNWEEFHENLF